MSILRAFYDQLVEFYGNAEPENWWPEDPLEVIVGAVLVPGSNWKIVAKILESLKSQSLLDFQVLRRLTPETLAEHVRSAGFQQRKAAALYGILEHIDAVSGGDLPRYFARNLETIRAELLAIKGIGAAVADNILLYAGKLPVYMVDPFTIRILARHGIVPANVKPDAVQRLIHQELTHEVEPYGADLFHSFQALIVRLGRTFCGKTDLQCEQCPLRDLLPAGGPVPLPVDSRSPKNIQRPQSPPHFGSPQWNDGQHGGAQSQAARSTPFASPAPSSSFSPPPAPVFPSLDELDLNEAERAIMERLDAERRPIDCVIEETGLPVHVVQSTLIGLEFRRLVRRCEGNTVARR